MARKSILKASGIISVITVFSRITGLLRTMLISQVLGASAFQDAFYAAFEIPVLLRRVLGEGSLSSVIVPIFTERRHKKGIQDAWLFLSNVFNLLALVSLLITAGFYILAPYIIRIFMWGYYQRQDWEILDIAVLCTRIMLPVMFLLALVALLMGVYNSMKRFALPAFGPVFINITIILTCILFFHVSHATFVILLSGAATLGLLVRFLSLYIPLRKFNSFHHHCIWNLKDPDLRKLFLLIAPGFIGMFIAYFNIFVDKMLATWIGEGVLTYLGNANYLVEFPLAIFATAVGTALLPILADNIVQNDLKALRKNLTFAMEVVILLLLPCIFGYIVLRENIIAMLFQRQNWTQEATINTSWALIFYSLGIIFYGFHRLYIAIYYAFKDVYTPLKTGAVAMLSNIVLNLLLFRTFLSFGGLALATSLAMGINVILMEWKLEKKHGVSISWPPLFKTFVMAFGVNTVLFGIVFYTKQYVFPEIYMERWLNILFTLVIIILYAGIYWIAMIIFHPDGKRVASIVMNKIHPKEKNRRK